MRRSSQASCSAEEWMKAVNTDVLRFRGEVEAGEGRPLLEHECRNLFVSRFPLVKKLSVWFPQVSCLLCPRRGGALKAVQPLDSAAAWRRLHDASTPPSPMSGKTCRWKRPLYVHMLCALHAPAPPVKIANNRQLSPVWGVDLLAAALQATRGSRCLGGHQQGSFGTKLTKAEDAEGLHYTVEHVKESPFSGVLQQSKASFSPTQWQGESCLIERNREDDEATRRSRGCCFCGHSSGFLVTCSYVRPVSRWRKRKAVYGYASTGPRLGLTSEEGDELDEWQDAYRVLGPHRTKALCTGAARYGVGAEDQEAGRCCRRRFHPICGQQQSVHVLFRTKNGDSQSFFFCLQVRTEEGRCRKEALQGAVGFNPADAGQPLLFGHFSRYTSGSRCADYKV